MGVVKLLSRTEGSPSRSSCVDNRKSGHFALFRSALDAPWATDTAKLALWVRLLSQARFKPGMVEFAGREWFLDAGQLVTTTAIMARKLRDQEGNEKSAKSVERMLNFFSREGMINTKGTPFGTVITITNYCEYQGVSGVEPSVEPPVEPKPSNGAGLRLVGVEPSVEPPVEQNKNVVNKNNKTPLYPPEGVEALAMDCLEYYNQLSGSRCSSAAAFEKALSTAKTKGVCYSVDEVKLVVRWAITCWKQRKTVPKPNNICTMTRFDGYLSDALIWADGGTQNPVSCPHEVLIGMWNEKFPSKAIALHEWNRRRPAYGNLEAVWNGKTNSGNWREAKHIGTAFDLIKQSSLFASADTKPWLTLDWVLNPKNWGQVYEQAINEHRQRKGVPA